MSFLYFLLIQLYQIGVKIASLTGNSKARLWINGRISLFEQMERKLVPGERRIWIHAASLGEFEQGRPIIEKIRADYPYYKIFLTFFSPSGYEVRNAYSGADYIFYLPVDSSKNATRLIDLVNPEKVFFIKYEFWYHYLSEIKKRNIPAYLCSAIFREDQLFFKSYGGWYRKMLSCFTFLFVQNEVSLKLLEKINFNNVKITGDTRFDRVADIAKQTRAFEEIKTFVDNKSCLIIGSSWEPDEEFVAQYINECTIELRFIIAPHEIHASHIEHLKKLIRKRVVCYSAYKSMQNEVYDVLIIDNIGMLSSLYSYGAVAYIGGGFGKGIHNILEAATFGLPVIFGPRFQKFQEAVELIKSGGAFSIENYEMLKHDLDILFTDPSFLKKASVVASQYVNDRTGATKKILDAVMLS